MSLRDRILTAESESEVKSLLQEGEDIYKFATQHTRRKWRSAAQKRISQLRTVGGPPP